MNWMARNSNPTMNLQESCCWRKGNRDHVKLISQISGVFSAHLPAGRQATRFQQPSARAAGGGGRAGRGETSEIQQPRAPDRCAWRRADGRAVDIKRRVFSTFRFDRRSQTGQRRAHATPLAPQHPRRNPATRRLHQSETQGLRYPRPRGTNDNFRPNTSGQRGDATRRGIAGADATQRCRKTKQGCIPGPRGCALPRRQNSSWRASVHALKILGSGAKPRYAPAVAVAPGVEQSDDFNDHSGLNLR